MSFKNIITEMKGKYNNILFQDPTEIKRDFDISYLIMNLNRFQHEGVQGVQLECGCYFFEGYLIQKMIENNKFCPSCSQPITIKGKEFITDEDEESSSSSSSTNNINEKFMQFGINESTIPEFNCSTSLHSQVINEPCSYCNYAINQEEKFSFCVECGNAFHIECVLNYWTGNPLKNGHCPKCDKLNDKSSSDNIQNEKTAYTLADLLKLPHTPGNGGVKELFNNSNNKYSPERELISDNQDLGRHSKHRKNKKKKNKGVFNCGSSLFSCGKSKNSRHSP